ncbi:MAG TPA: hypothetical protein VN721_11215 [Flavipsychrobacter sp.]|nr:hypothetical protein [Flavipsychrobacter sp.]
MEKEIGNKYVAFCDILGFSNLVLNEFDKTIRIYRDFRIEIDKRNELIGILVSVYSDSIIIVDDDLMKVAEAAQLLQWTTLRHGWLVRGGIGYGKHWKESNNNNLFIVSEALVKAVNIEKSIKYPVIAIDSGIKIGLEYWLHGFVHSVFDLPIIHHLSTTIINPFNNYWFKSAEIKLKKLRSCNENHIHKYDYLLELIEAINLRQSFLPQEIIDDLLNKNLIEKID